MNYAAHYQKLIERARNRILDGYRERHHVNPRCLGGNDAQENLVYLTPEEHYVAHQLLVKIHPLNKRLAHAAVMMSVRCTGNKAYGWLKRRSSEARRGNSYCVGRFLSQETKDKISASKRGKQLSEVTRHKIGLAHRGRTRSMETRRNISISKMGKRRVFSEQHRANLSLAGRGRKGERRPPVSAETRAKIAAALLGKIRGPYKKRHTKLDQKTTGD